MTDIDRYDRLHDLARRLEGGVGLLEAIHDAMAVSPYSAEAFVPAICAAQEYLADVERSLKQLKTDEQPQPPDARQE